MAQLSTRLPWELAQTKWASILNPLIALPILNGNFITQITLLANIPTPINHLLQRMPLGWILTDNSTQAVVWRSAPFNQFTLTLTSDLDNTISIWVF